jgi:hypothetical protein
MLLLKAFSSSRDPVHTVFLHRNLNQGILALLDILAPRQAQKREEIEVENKLSAHDARFCLPRQRYGHRKRAE